MKPITRILWFVPIVLVVGYALTFYWLSETENDHVYPLSTEMQPLQYGVTCTPVVLLTNDGMRLSAWAMPDTVGAHSRIWVLFLHGSGGNISTRSQLYSKLIQRGYYVLALDYRGYGQSEGEPGETGLYLDANAAYEYLVRNLQVPEHHIVIFGKSLGAAVAINLATYADAGGVIVEGAFTSLVDRAQELYPIFPVRKVMKNRFDCLSRITQVGMPKLFIHAIDDDVIPIDHGRRLFEIAPPPKTFVEVRGGHNDAYLSDEKGYFGGFTKFVRDVTSDTSNTAAEVHPPPVIPENH